MVRVYCACCVGPGVAEAELTTRPESASGPTRVTIQVTVLDLESVSSANQNFTANIAFRAGWTDERLRHEGTTSRIVSLDDIWHPRLQIVNRQRVQASFADEAIISPEGEVSLIQRLWGSFSQAQLLHEFPFDRQSLRVELVSTGQDGGIEFVEDPEHPSAVSSELLVSDWKLNEWRAEIGEIELVEGGKPVDSCVLVMDIERQKGYYIAKVIVPLLMIIAMSWVVFWVNPSNAGPRISVGVTTMLTLMAYRFAIGSALPKIGYLTRLDWFILGSTVLVFLGLMMVGATTFMVERGKEEAAQKVNRAMRIIAPAVTIIVAVWSLILA